MTWFGNCFFVDRDDGWIEVLERIDQFLSQAGVDNCYVPFIQHIASS